MLSKNSPCLVVMLFLILAVPGTPPAPAASTPLGDISSIPPDLTVPEATDGPPAPGRRVRQQLQQYEHTQVYHLLYLPADWQPGLRYPVIVEYAGNGNYQNKYGDVSTGLPEGSKLGYGISGGRGFIWICMPYVNTAQKKNEIQWWGDVPATLDYCIETVRLVCERYGGDPGAVLLTGFSRGAIGCNYLGLHNDRIADLWLGFIPYSHYDGVRDWNWEGGRDKAAARERLLRLRGRASFVCQEGSTSATQRYLAAIPQDNPFTFVDLPFHNHNDAWTLRDTPQRRQLRSWVAEVLRRRPGTHLVRGRVTDADGHGLSGVRMTAGETHWTLTDSSGRYVLPSLTGGERLIQATVPGHRFAPAKLRITLAGHDVDGADFHLHPLPGSVQRFFHFISVMDLLR